MLYLDWSRRQAALAHADFLEKYESLKEGMSVEEVKAVLGAPLPDDPWFSGGGLQGYRALWRRGDDAIYVDFGGGDDLSVKKFGTKKTLLRVEWYNISKYHEPDSPEYNGPAQFKLSQPFMPWR